MQIFLPLCRDGKIGPGAPVHDAPLAFPDLLPLLQTVDSQIQGVKGEYAIGEAGHLLVEVPEGVVPVALILGKGRSRIF